MAKTSVDVLLVTAAPLSSFAVPWSGSLIGAFLASVIYGITVLQTFYYFMHYGHDHIWLRVLVAIAFALDSAALGLLIYAMQFYLVTSWGNSERLLTIVDEISVEYFLSAIVVFLVQCFYIKSIRALRVSPVITAVLCLLSIVAFSTGIALPILQIRLKNIEEIVSSHLNHIIFNVARGCALACDVGIVVALCSVLGLHKMHVRRMVGGDASFDTSSNIINALMAFTVQRGALQAIAQAGEVIAYGVRPRGMYFLTFHVIASRIYCCSFLATLNARDYILSKGSSDDSQGSLRVHPTRPIPVVAREGGRNSGALDSSSRPNEPAGHTNTLRDLLPGLDPAHIRRSQERSHHNDFRATGTSSLAFCGPVQSDVESQVEEYALERVDRS